MADSSHDLPTRSSAPMTAALQLTDIRGKASADSGHGPRDETGANAGLSGVRKRFHQFADGLDEHLCDRAE
jgi:hypothetical protein